MATPPPTTSPITSTSDSDSIFASRSPSPSNHASASTHNPRAITSEQPLLLRTHHTQGYRSGISAGRDDPAISQAGFDDGFPVGMALGLRAGWVIAALEVAVEGEGRQVDDADEADGERRDKRKEELSGKLKAAREELAVERLVEEMRQAGELREVGDVLVVEAGAVERLPTLRRWEASLVELGLRGRPT